EEIRVVLALIETVRDGPVFIESVRASLARGKPVVSCRIGTGRHGKTLMTTHTGAMAVPEAVLEGVLEYLGVVIAETPGEAYDIAEVMARVAVPAGPRVAIVTHSGGIAIHLADLAERHRIELADAGPELQTRLAPLLDLGAANNPLDMGGIIGGPGRFGEVVETFAESGEYDMVLAVSTAHPPAHTEDRVTALIARSAVVDVPIVHLWMAGDQAGEGLRVLRAAGAALTEEPRAAVRAMAALAALSRRIDDAAVEPITGAIESWGLPMVEGGFAADPSQAVAVAERIGYPVVVKVSAPGMAHKTEVGGVRLDLKDAKAVMAGFDDVTASGRAAGLPVAGARVERFRPGLEMIVGGLVDPVFGPVVSVGIGGVMTELLDDVVFAPAPVTKEAALKMIDRLGGRRLLDGFRGSDPPDVLGLARVISLLSRGLVGSGLTEVELNPLIWDGEWVAVDWLVGAGL
ncbi:MAG TPA: acetate--CoA ligase family protein, partial [Acidimicrobiia bacterium]|nr:acetate--CoA ligase family protein [Acidimicrobiia bacterium]